MSDEIIILKIFGSRQGRREYKPKQQIKFLILSEANDYIARERLCLFDLVVNGKIVNRNGLGKPTKHDKQEPTQSIRYVTETSEQNVFDFLKSQTNVIPVNHYPFKKGGNQFAVQLANRDDANRFYKYLNSNAAFAVLQTDRDSFSISFTVVTTDFNQSVKWEPKETPQTSTIKSWKQQATEPVGYSDFAKILDMLG